MLHTHPLDQARALGSAATEPWDLRVGAWRIRLRPWGPDIGPAMALRAARFRGGADDRDAHDAAALHLTIARAGDADRPSAYARLTRSDRAAMAAGYAARFYDLGPFAARHAPALEVGRVCLDGADPDLPRLLLAALARALAAFDARALYGCASFPGIAPPALALLRPHRAPDWGPRRRSPDAIDLPAMRTGTGAGAGAAVLPPLLRLYLALGAVVSDHAVIDRDLRTTHVLAMLPAARVAPARARRLQAMLAPA